MSLSRCENGLDICEDTDFEDWQLPVAFMKKRHTEPIEGIKTITQTWRMKERMKTVSVALVLCLNVGVDPPDIIKTQPCARLECWIDPLSTSPQKALEAIGNNLQKQYERWQPRARYKQTLDPTVDEVKKLCTSLRRNAKEERVLFHYNGHGVPKPTQNGEIWVFNKTYTQYIPLSIYDLQTWMGAPSIYVYDCSSAGTIIDSFKQFANQHEQEYEQISAQNKGQYPPHLGTPVSFKNCIQLGACSSNQVLPMNPELPADLFTACLTTPIKIALRWFVMQNTAKLVPGISLDLIDKIPGQLNDRRTMLGELNWIFTAITDTIAWNTLPRELFQKLFRQDLLVASLFRNFLLAERIMRSYNCTPVSSPVLPLTNKHAMWQAWDLALDICLTQLPAILEKGEAFEHSPFFAEQLTAFQVWLTFGSDTRSPPEQLPIVLQVLLSQVHRLRALELLGRFLDLGPWAVNLALSVGIFPYVLKLLQSSARELRPLLVFIWAKILAVDSTCQADLVRDNGHKYFLAVLEDVHMPAEHRTMSAFVLACIVHNYSLGQEAARQGNLVSVCLEQLVDPNPLLRQWLAICLGRIWMDFDVARWCGVRDSAHEKLYRLLKDDVPEVRAAALFALGTFMSCATERSDHANTIDHSVAMSLVNKMSHEASPLVRQELVVALHWLVLMFENQFLAVAYQTIEEEKLRENAQNKTVSPSGTFRKLSAYTSRDKVKLIGSPVNSTSPILSTSSGSLESSGSGDGTNIHLDKIRRVSSSSSITSLGALIGAGSPYLTVPYGSIYSKVWNKILNLAADPDPGVGNLSNIVVQYIKKKVTQALVQTKDTISSDVSLSAPSSPSSKPSYISGDSPPATMTLSQDGSRPSSAIHWNSGSGQQRVSFFHSLTRPKKSVDNKPMNITAPSSSEDELASTAKTALCTTEFVDWSCKYFSQSVTNYSEDYDPESLPHQEREWRFLRNARVRRESEEEQKRAMFGRLDDQVFINRNANIPSLIKFHPFEPIICVADRDNFSIWNWEQGARLSYLQNNNPKLTRITSMEFINAHDSTLLLFGSDDGAVRIWKNVVDDNKNVQLVTAWQALGEMLPSTRGSGLITEWDQESCILYTSGDVRLIRLWDAEREKKFQDIPTGADSCVTSLSCNSTGQPLLAAGCGDGSIRLYDRRLPSNESRIMTFREHSSWVVNVHVQKKIDAENKIVSGSVAGDVRFWDMRVSTSVMTCMAAHGMTAMSVHPNTGVFACGSANQFISIFTATGEHLSLIKYYDGFMGQRIGPISCLHFHPYKVSLAAGSTDFFVSVYSVDKKR